MKQSNLTKALLFPLAVILVSCTHMQVLGPQADWIGKTKEFPLYSITVPNDTRWWFLSADQKSQTISLVVPAADKSRELLLKDGKPTGMVMIQTTGGPTHPNAYTLYDGMADVYLTPVPDAMKEIPDQTVIDGYLHDDASLYLNGGMLKQGAQYQVGQTKFGARDFSFSHLQLDGKVTGHIYVACSAVTVRDNRYLLAGRLWSEQSPQRDFEYLAMLLSSVTTK